MTSAPHLWTVYRHPRDYPAGYVARLHVIERGGMSRATDQAFYGPTLANVRAQLPPGLIPLSRHPKDDPKIVEVWI